jgi:hypothetical protein
MERTGVSVSASLRVEASAETIYRFLCHLPNHARFANAQLALLALAEDGHGGTIAIRGPFGLRRVAETTVTEMLPHSVVGGTATVGRRTSALVRWTVRPDGDGGSRVALTATILTAGRADRLLLALGGRRWLARAFALAIARLAEAMAT